MNRTKFLNIAELRKIVAQARKAAEKEARQSCGKGFIKSRGAWWVVTRKDGGEPTITAEILEFNGTAKQVRDVINEYGTSETDGIYIEGGFNFAESLNDFRDGSYDPWVSEWSVIVWPKD